jgi:hypothetical protein
MVNSMHTFQVRAGAAANAAAALAAAVLQAVKALHIKADPCCCSVAPLPAWSC